MINFLKAIYDLLIKAFNFDNNAINVVITGGTTGTAQIYEKGSVDVVNVSSQIITFTNPPYADYIPYVAIEDNLNIWFTSIGTGSFTVNFSAPYTGKIRYCIIK